MKRLAGLTALALVIGNTSGCGWLWGPEGYFRDRGDDYLGARETPPMQLPEGAGREAIMEEGTACYKIFINGLLDVTDNLDEEKIIPPRDLVRRDGDAPYLVVAADKGTATFSDTANGIAEERGFWMGDAFASGGSVGYDQVD